MRSGRRLTGERVVLYLSPAMSRGRTAFVAGRAVGGSVERNRARRLMREAFRAVVPQEPQWDAVLVARPGIAGSRSTEVAAEVRELLARAGAAR